MVEISVGYHSLSQSSVESQNASGGFQVVHTAAAIIHSSLLSIVVLSFKFDGPPLFSLSWPPVAYF